MKRAIEFAEQTDAGTVFYLSCFHALKEGPHALGDEVECLECEALNFPAGLRAYKKTPTFNQKTVPKGFRRAHSTKSGVWAVIQVVSGRVSYVVDDLDNRAFELDDANQGIIAPQMRHHLELIGDVKFYVEFYTK